MLVYSCIRGWFAILLLCRNWLWGVRYIIICWLWASAYLLACAGLFSFFRWLSLRVLICYVITGFLGLLCVLGYDYGLAWMYGFALVFLCAFIFISVMGFIFGHFVCFCDLFFCLILFLGGLCFVLFVFVFLGRYGSWYDFYYFHGSSVGFYMRYPVMRLVCVVLVVLWS